MLVMINSVTKECNLKQEYTILNCIFYDVITLVLYCKSYWLVNYPENNLKDEFSSNVPQVAQVLKPGSRNSAGKENCLYAEMQWFDPSFFIS